MPTAPASIRTMLSGGDLRSIGNADKVASRVLSGQGQVEEFFACLHLEEPVVRMRAADALEKISLAKPELIQKFKADILKKIAAIPQQEVQWHVAQILPRLKLSAKEVGKAHGILEDYLNNSKSNIVRVMALQALADFALQEKLEKKDVVKRLVDFSEQVHTPSVCARAKKLLKILGRAR